MVLVSFLCAFSKAQTVQHGASNAKIMRSITSNIYILELIKMYAFNAMCIPLD